MRKILFGVFFLAVTIRYADASIVSSGFLDEMLENYVTKTALDLKADKADLIALETKVGTLPTGFDLWGALNGFFDNPDEFPLPSDVGGILSWLFSTDTSVPSLNGIVDKITYGYVDDGGMSIDNRVNGLKYLNEALYGLSSRSLPSGETNSVSAALSDLSDKELFVSYPESVYDMITDLYKKNGIFDVIINTLDEDLMGLYWLTQAVKPIGYGLPSLNLVDNLPYFSELFSGLSLTLPKMSDYSFSDWIRLSHMSNDFPGLAGVTNKLLNGWTNADKATYHGIKGLNDIIGNWSADNDMLDWGRIPYLDELFPGFPKDNNWAKVSIADVIGVTHTIEPEVPSINHAIVNLLYGWRNSEKKSYPGIKGMFDGWTDSDKVVHSGLNTISTDYDALLNAYSAQSLLNLLMKGGLSPIDNNTTVLPLHALSAEVSKIGELPIGPMSATKGLSVLLPDARFTYPESLGEFMFSMYDMMAPYPSLGKLADAVYLGTMDNPSINESYWVKGLGQITQEIGTLPTGEIPMVPGWDIVLERLRQKPVYPTSLSQLIELLYGTTGIGPGVLPDIASTAIAAQINAEASVAKIGTLPTELTVGANPAYVGLFGVLKNATVTLPADYTLSQFIKDMYYGQSSVTPKSPFPGLADIADRMMYGGQWKYMGADPVNYMGLLGLSEKIGTLPSGPTLGLGRTGVAEPLYQDVQETENPVLPSSLAELINQIYGTTTKQGIITTLLKGFNSEGSLLGIMPAMEAANTAQTTADTAKSVADANTAKIGNWSEANPYLSWEQIPYREELFPDVSADVNWSVQTMSNVFGFSYLSNHEIPSLAGAIDKILKGWTNKSGKTYPGIKAMFDGWTDSDKVVHSGLDKISADYYEFLHYVGVDSLWDLVLHGGNSNIYGMPDLLPLIDISMGVSKIGTVPNGKTVVGMITDAQNTANTAQTTADTAKTTADTAKTTADTAKTTADTAKSVADANTAKIGTVPSEYSTVGDALTAMDAKIDAHELPADSDDGQYVLTAKKVGGAITYVWVKMDLATAEK